MVLSDESEDQIYSKLFDLCTKLNLDSKTIETAWDNFRSINKNFVLEGDTLHWLGCAVFVASHSAITPTLLCTFVRGNCISLTSLLRHSNLSFVQFFYNINKWAEMAHLSDDFQKKITYLKDTFGVTHNTFKEYCLKFPKIFLPPTPQDLDQPKQHRNRKQRPLPCNSVKVFEFVWNFFITLKAEESQYCTELIKSYHLLYACLDLAFKNAYLSERRDLLNPQFEYLPSNWNNSTFQKPTEAPCLISYLCKSPSALTEAMHVKIYGLKNLMNSIVKKNSNKKVLSMDSMTFLGLLDKDVFEQNFKNITGIYDSHLLNKIDIDERIFLAEYKRQLLEQSFIASVRVESGENSVAESPRGNLETVSRGGDTPLTGRRFLGPREADLPPSSTDRNIQRLLSILNNRSPAPSEALLQLFQSCEKDPLERIQSIIKNLGDKFLFVANDIDKSRLELGITLFYKFVENILQNEKSIHKDISSLVEKDLFYQCMFTCCLEIVLFSYGSSNKFPWILNALDIQAFHFVKVIELIVRCRDQLSREMIKHLNKIEETVLENLAWKSNSQLWEIIDVLGQGIPKFEDTALPGHLLYNSQNVDIKKTPSSDSSSPGFQSPPSATDRFQSPNNQNLSLNRQQFPGIQAGQSVLQKHTHIMITDKDGNKKLIPIVDNVTPQQNQNGHDSPPPSAPVTPKRTGSLSIIFRKVYNLAGVRMEHLCNKLGLIDMELKQKIWTVFEESIRNSDLIKDRHLDQLLMCAIYVICRISNISLKFQDIMKFYREQPQCSSSVYRDVLLTRQSVNEDGAIIPEERSDLIHFYNSVYVEIMQKTAMRFRNAAENSNLLLSPLPAIKRDLVRPSVQVLGNVYVKPLDSPSVNMGNSYNYFFSRSPSKDLKDINKLVNGSGLIRKRLLVEGDSEVPPSKRISNRKLQSLVEERRSQNTD